jgi:iron complex transport system substrate-binding protein
MSASLSRDHIVDEAGRRIEVTSPFSRVISLYGAHTENLYALSAAKSLVAVSNHETFPPRVLNKPSLSYHDGLEKFLAFCPDLVLIRPMIDQGYTRLVSRLEQAGVVVVSLQPRTVNDMYTYWKILGRLVGCQARAQQMVSSFEKGLRFFHLLNTSIAHRKKVYFEAMHSQMKTFAPQSIAIFALETAGGINIANNARVLDNSNIAAFGKERILAHANEIEVYLAQKGPMNQPNCDMIRNEPGFSIIQAVQANTIAVVNEQLVSRPTMRLLQGIFRIGHILYPSLYTPEVGQQVTRAIESGTSLKASLQ